MIPHIGSQLPRLVRHRLYILEVFDLSTSIPPVEGFSGSCVHFIQTTQPYTHRLEAESALIGSSLRLTVTSTDIPDGYKAAGTEEVFFLEASASETL